MNSTRKSKKRGKKRQSSNRQGWRYVAAVVAIGLVLFGSYVVNNIPNPKKLTTDEYPESSKILDRNGNLLYEFYTEQKRTSVPLEKIPDNLKKATLAIEDANFYRHIGFDLRGMLRGFYRSVFQKRLQGGSTITQQLVKNALLTPERTIERKFKEAILTVATEILYNKDEILEMYFNQTPYGGTLWGADAAASGIFNKKVSDLSLAEAALLAGLPGSPSRYSPFAHPDAAKARQEMVLERMLELEFINQEEYDKAKNEELKYYLERGKIEAPHFVFYIKEILIEKYGLQKVNEGGLKVTTSLDLEMQKLAEVTVATEVGKLERYNVTNGAVVITEPKTGEILAMVGSKDYFSEDIDGKYNVTTALRQPGSSIKPLNYAVGLELGNITAATVLADEPTCFRNGLQKPYCPTNYGNSYHGIQTVRNSLANSLNIAAVKVLKLNGIETFVASASAMGISSFTDPSRYGLSLTLGGGEVKMVDMAVAFGALANGGVKQELVPILKIEDRKGEVLEQVEYSTGDRVLSRETAFLIQQILSDDGARSMVFGRGSLLNIKGQPEVAVKTGTTNELRDNWTIGYTPDMVITVWVGNNDNSRMSGVVSGISGAAPIWNKLMTELLKDKPVKKPVRPADIVGVNVCNLTGGLAEDSGCASHYEYFKKEFLPKRTNVVRQNVLIDKDTGRIVSEAENKPNTEWQEHDVVIDATGVWYCLDCNWGEEIEKKSAIIN